MWCARTGMRALCAGVAAERKSRRGGARGERGADGCDWMRVVAAAYVQVSLNTAP